MQMQISTDSNIEGHEAPAEGANTSVRRALSGYSDRITRVEVHLSDENISAKEGPDAMRCLIEARIEGRRPISVSHQARSVSEALDGGAGKLGWRLDSALGIARGRRSRSAQVPLSAPSPAGDG